MNDIKIRKLSTLVDRLVTNSAGAFTAVNTELIAIRSMVLQNRLALDILLANEGGVCCLLKVQQCCTYIPDPSKEIGRYINNLTGVSNDAKKMAKEGAWEKVKK